MTRLASRECCGICGSYDIGCGSWSGAWCNNCGALEIIDEWQAKPTSEESQDD